MAEPETQPAGDQGAATQPQWYQPAESLRTTDPEVWTSFEKGVTSGAHKDFPTLVKNHVNLERKLGSMIVPPAKDAKPEEVQAFKEKLYATGHIAKPPVIPESPDKYEIKPDIIPEDRRLPEIMTKAQAWAHKWGLPQEAFDEGMALNAEQFAVTEQLFKGSEEEARARVAEVLKSEGRVMDNAFWENGHRAARRIFKNPETFAKLDKWIGNDPDFNYVMDMVGNMLGEDTHELPPDGGGGGAAADAQADLKEAAAIKDDPAHPKHEAYLKEGLSGPLHTWVDNAYKKVHGTGEVI